MGNLLFTEWLEHHSIEDAPDNVTVFRECRGNRDDIVPVLRDALHDHFVGLEIIQNMGGFPKAAAVIRNALPGGKRIRSGDFGEILGTEYIDRCTKFTVPIRRLRYKDDRDMAMRGDDMLGFDFASEPLHVMKAEAKSRVQLNRTVVSQASDGLKRHSGRPNPSTLSFVSRRLREQGKHELAKAIERLQEIPIMQKQVQHLIFTLSQNDPITYLSDHKQSPFVNISRQLVGCQVDEHAKLIESIFDSATSEETVDGES